MSDDRTLRGALAAQQLCGALWEAFGDAVRAGRDREAITLSRRLVEVCAAVADLTRAGGRSDSEAAGSASSAAERGARAPAREEGALPPARTIFPAPANVEAEWRSRGVEATGRSQRVEGRSQRVETRSQRGETEGRLDPSGPHGEARVVDEQAGSEQAGAGLPIDERSSPGAAAIVDIRDARGDDGAPWTIAVERRLKRYAEDHDPFAVMIVALDADGVHGSWRDANAEEATRALEQTIVGELRPADVLMRERDGRYWLIALGTDGFAAKELAARMRTAARLAGGARGTRFEVSFGIAICPDDGRDARSLLSRADLDLYAAQSRRSASRDFGWDDRPSPA